MGPGAVAQFLPAGGIEFDMLVVDEASQVRPEDSLGSLARAKQIVIVGDSKQMPPTDVFSVHAEHDEDDEDETGPAEELESILDVFSNFLSAPFARLALPKPASQPHSLLERVFLRPQATNSAIHSNRGRAAWREVALLRQC